MYPLKKVSIIRRFKCNLVSLSAVWILTIHIYLKLFRLLVLILNRDFVRLMHLTLKSYARSTAILSKSIFFNLLDIKSYPIDSTIFLPFIATIT